MIPEPLSKIAEELAENDEWAAKAFICTSNCKDLGKYGVCNECCERRIFEVGHSRGFAAAYANDKLKALHRAEAFEEAKKFVPCLPGNISEYPLNKIWHRLDRLAAEERAKLESK